MAIQSASTSISTPIYSVSNFAIDNFEKSQKCAVMISDDLTDAFLLAPCGHSISKVAREEMYKGGNNVHCPLCQTRVIECYPNHTLNSIVSQSVQMKLVDVLRTVSDGQKEQSIPFPGTQARFVHASGDWEVLDSGTDLAREMEFHSITRGSLFERFVVLGWKTGEVALTLKFLGKDKTISYLNDCGVQAPTLGSKGYSNHSYRSNSLDTKALFEVIAKHNDIPKHKFALIRDLVFVADWKTVTPLKWDEKSILEREYSHLRTEPYFSIFPGKKAEFALSSDHWEIPLNGIKKLGLTSTSEASLFQKLVFLGYESGSIGILITFKGKDETIFYLNRCGMDVPTKNSFNAGVRYSDHCYLAIGDKSELLFKILTKNNNFPEKELQFVRKLVTNHEWKERSYSFEVEKKPLITNSVQDDIPPPPLGGADFMLTGGNWEIFDSETDVVRKLEFTSVSLDCLFRKMDILGFRDGRVAISIKFVFKGSAFKYLNQCGMNICIDEDLDYHTKELNAHCYQSTPENTQLLFQIIARHNVIPEEQLSLISELVVTGDWRKVTPVEDGENPLKKRKV